jgi:hypothetical protein
VGGSNHNHNYIEVFIMQLTASNKTPKKKAISKKDLVRKVIEFNDNYDVDSLMRTNSQNLEVILDTEKRLSDLA